MGTALVTAAPIDDYRIDRAMKTFDIPAEKIQVLWNIFCRLNRNLPGNLAVSKYFEKHLKIKRSRIANAMFDLLDIDVSENEDKLTFPQYVELTCTFACMEQLDLVKFVFYALDSMKTGTVDKNELKHLVYDMWDNKVTSNIHVGLSYLDAHDNNGDGRFTFKEIYEMHVRCPQIFYPTFRIQQAIIRYSLGTIYWEWHKRYLIEGQEERKAKEIARLRRAQQLKDSRVTDDIVQQRMGIAWYLFPWLRQTVRERLVKIAIISAELDAIEHEIEDESERPISSKTKLLSPTASNVVIVT